MSIKRNIFKATYFAAMCILLLSFLNIARAIEIKEAQIFGSEVNMRQAPDKSSEVVSKPSSGQVVSVINQGKEWSLVEYDQTQGYIRNDLLFFRSSKGRLAFALKDNVNIRGGPGTSAYIIKKTEVGKPMSIKQMVGEWYYVSYGDVVGFVQKDLVSVTEKEGKNSGVLLKFGMEGSEVLRVQKELVRRNFLKEESLTGTFGRATQNAVIEFQTAAKMEKADGVVGEQTLSYLFDGKNTIKKAPKIPQKKEDFYDRVEIIDWWKGGNKILKRPGGVAKIYDVRSGKIFRIRRTGGNKHNDCVPFSANDTAIMKSAYSGVWTDERRPVLVIVGSKVYAGSMYGRPHGSDVQKNDNYPGVLCIHFLNSRTHGGNNLDSKHQAMIRYAYNKFKKK